VNAKKKPELASMREQLENMFVRLEEFIMTAKKELVQTAIDLSMDVRNADSSDASQEDLLQGPVSSEVCTARGLQRCQKVTSFEDIFQTDEDTSLEDAFQPEQFCQHGFPPILEEEVHFYERHLDEHSANHSSPEADGSASPCWAWKACSTSGTEIHVQQMEAPSLGSRRARKGRPCTFQQCSFDEENGKSNQSDGAHKSQTGSADNEFLELPFCQSNSAYN